MLALGGVVEKRWNVGGDWIQHFGHGNVDVTEDCRAKEGILGGMMAVTYGCGGICNEEMRMKCFCLRVCVFALNNKNYS